MAKIVRLFHASPLNTQRNSRRNEHTLFRGIIHSEIFETARTICHHYHPGPLHVICFDCKLHETNLGHSKQKNYGVLLKQLAPSPSRRRCKIAKVRMRKCKGARAKVQSEMDTPIASSPLQLHNLVFALSHSSFSFRLVDYL